MLSSLMLSGALYLTGLFAPLQLMFILLGAVAFSYILFKKDLPSTDDTIRLINEQIPAAEYSVSLLHIAPPTNLAKLQQHRITQNLLKHTTKLRYPSKMSELIWVLVISLSIATGVHFLFQTDHNSLTTDPERANIRDQDLTQPKAPTTYTSSITIVPPVYSRLPDRQQDQQDLHKILKGSVVKWQLRFNYPPQEAWLVFSNGDRVRLQQKEEDHSATVTANQKGFYSIQHKTLEGEIQSSEYYTFDVITDEPPVVAIADIPQYQSIYPGELDKITFLAKVTDDFGLTDAYLVATITKGSGESVRFREEKIRFSKPAKGKKFHERVTFSVDEFELEPGNELYFYLEAWDNQSPYKASRTETFFLVLEDTAEVAFSLEGDLGVDLMPEYFRSQRQIIIDSEKLLADKGSISTQAFNQRSNALGFDQKSLRLKYGQFLGEETDSGLDIQNEVEEEPSAQTPGEVDVLSEFGHDHDHENEEGQLLDKGTEAHEDPIAELSHSHDDLEQATFFEESMKSKLKAALNEMWDAELYLRLYKPEQSLPYQYRALKLIKEVKNHARIYVHRMGFDPPPIKEAESRLSGDLDEVHGATFTAQQTYHEAMEATRSLIQLIGQLETSRYPLQNDFIEPMEAAGTEIAAKAISEPGKYLGLLAALRATANTPVFVNPEALRSIKIRLIAVLDSAPFKPTLPEQGSHELLDLFVSEIIKKEP